MGDPVIPQPLADDDDDVAWALQTAAVQWQRGGHEDAVVWVRRAVDAAIATGSAKRTKELTNLAAGLSERIARGEFGSPPAADVQSGEADEIAAESVPPSVAPARPPPPPSALPRPPSAVPRPTSSAPPRAPSAPPSARPSNAPGPRASSAPGPRASTAPGPRASTAPSARPSSVTPPRTSAPPTAITSPPSSGAAAIDDLPDLTPEEFDEPGVPSVGERRRSIVAADELAERFSAGVDDIPDLSPDEFASPSGAPGPVASPRASVPPASLPPEAPASADSGGPAPGGPEADEKSPPSSAGGPPAVDGVALEDVQGLQDLPEDAQIELARSARLTNLSSDEEVGTFGAALVTRGRVVIMSAIADAAAGFASPGDIVFTRGTLEEGTALRVVAMSEHTRVASWSREALDEQMEESPWVADELRHVADRFQALAGATLGPLGDSLDDGLRTVVMEKLEAKSLSPGEVIVESGHPVPGLYVVGGGGIELLEAGSVVEELGPGDFLFASLVLSGGSANRTARATSAGALVLFATRAAAQELALSVPPLIEILAG